MPARESRKLAQTGTSRQLVEPTTTARRRKRDKAGRQINSERRTIHASPRCRRFGSRLSHQPRSYDTPSRPSLRDITTGKGSTHGSRTASSPPSLSTVSHLNEGRDGGKRVRAREDTVARWNGTQ